jgi:hypothetical protein
MIYKDREESVKRVGIAIALLLFAVSAQADVLVLENDYCIKDVEDIQWVRDKCFYVKDGKRYSVHKSSVIRRQRKAPPDAYALTGKELEHLEKAGVTPEILVLANDCYIKGAKAIQLVGDQYEYEKNGRKYFIKKALVVGQQLKVPKEAVELTGIGLENPDMVVKYVKREVIAILPPIIYIQKMRERDDFIQDNEARIKMSKIIVEQLFEKLPKYYPNQNIRSFEEVWEVNTEKLLKLISDEEITNYHIGREAYKIFATTNAKGKYRYILITSLVGYAQMDDDRYDKMHYELTDRDDHLRYKPHREKSKFIMAIVDIKKGVVVSRQSSEVYGNPTRTNTVSNQLNTVLSKR